MKNAATMVWGRGLVLASILSALFLAPAIAAPSYSITLYEHKNYEGRTLTLTGAEANLKGSGLNDRVSSLKLVLGQKWLLCKNKKFRGGCIIVDRDVPDLEALGFNDQISSVKPAE